MPTGHIKRTSLHWFTLPHTTVSYVLNSMDIIGPNHETENVNQYAYTVICMLIKYVLMIPIKLKTTEEVMKAYLENVYSAFGGSQYILSDKGGEYGIKQFHWLANKFEIY